MDGVNGRIVFAGGLVLALFAALAVWLAAVVAAPEQAEAQQASIAPQFITNCGFNFTDTFDPITDKDPSHRHEFFGGDVGINRSRDALLSGGTTCNIGADKSGYWIPMLVNSSGKRIAPKILHNYYRVGYAVDPRSVRRFPVGWEVIAGDHMAEGPQPGIIQWTCSGGDADNGVTDEPRNCPKASDPNPTVRVIFPDCADGDPRAADYQSHAAYSRAGECPTGFYPVPKLFATYEYPANRNVEGARLSMDAAMHGDFQEAWRSDALERLMDRCLRDGTGCDLRASKNAAG